jgi:hypothetical protein
MSTQGNDVKCRRESATENVYTREWRKMSSIPDAWILRWTRWATTTDKEDSYPFDADQPEKEKNRKNNYT